jgi:ribonuclease P protein component
MLPKKRRLSSAEVREVLARGKSVRGSVISLKYVVNKGIFRAGVVAPKSVAKRAVDRNRLRRALYQALATLPTAKTQQLSHIMAIFFIRSIPSPLTPALRDDISGILSKIPPSHV